jgi:hypothetical protein
MAMGGDRRAVPEQLLLVWYVVVAPIGGAAAAATLADGLLPAFTAAWLRGVCVVLSGACGLLAGGAIGSYLPRSVTLPAKQVVRTVVLTTAAASVVLISTGTPLPWMYATAGALIASITIAWTMRRHAR